MNNYDKTFAQGERSLDDENSYRVNDHDIGLLDSLMRETNVSSRDSRYIKTKHPRGKGKFHSYDPVKDKIFSFMKFTTENILLSLKLRKYKIVSFICHYKTSISLEMMIKQE